MKADNPELLERYHKVLNHIRKLDPDQKVSLLAVSKTKPIEDIVCLAEAGQKSFGENYLQEALEKITARPDLDWHFIGPIQSNKTKPIAENFNWVHSVDRLKIAQRLSNQRPTHLPPLKILLEINVDAEESKSGFTPDEVISVAAEIAELPNLALKGLMAIPAHHATLETQRQPFRKMHELLETLQQQLPEQNLDTLSMGMSADLEAAILEGATIVRIGTDIFGAREVKK